MEIKLKLSNEEHKDLIAYCNLNDLLVSQVVKDSFTTGFNIERYGLLNTSDSGEIVKEVLVEKIVEVTKEVPVDRVVEKVVEVIKEIPVDNVVIKEVVKEVPVEKIVYVTDQEELTEKIFQKEQDFEAERIKFSNILQEQESFFQKEKQDLLSKLQKLESQEPQIVEVIKEVQSEKNLNSKLEALQNTIQILKQENTEKEKKLKEYEQTIRTFQEVQTEKRAMFLRGSNLE